MVKIKGFFKDIKGTNRIIKMRKEQINNASSEPIIHDPIKALANELHPKELNLKIEKIIDETPTTKTYRFIKSYGPDIPYFQAGQYISFKLNIGESFVTRPYTISSAPYETLGKKPYIEVTIKLKPDGFVSKYIFENWKVGTEVTASMPLGHFYYEPLRDTKNIVAIAGGSGITPFRSMAKEIANGKLDINLTILYGSRFKNDIIFYEELKTLADENSENIKIVNILSDEKFYKGEKGFINSKIIKKYSDPKNTTYFACGPEAMYKFIDNEIAKLNIETKRYRKEISNDQGNIYEREDFPEKAKDKIYKIKVNIACESFEISANSKEPVLVALERAGIKQDSNCRAGECGFCRSRLDSGKVYVNKDNDGRRKADIKYGYFHPCSSYPISDLEMTVFVS